MHTNLSMNFGKPSLKIREPFDTTSRSEVVQRLAARRRITLRGQWRLWLWCCYWKLSVNDKVLATGSSSARRIERAAACLDGQKLTGVRVNPSTGATRFAFDLGAVLDCRRFEKGRDDELWLLYEPSGFVLSVHGNGTFCHHRGSEVSKRLRRIEDGTPLDGE
jgi:hypothetical protein